MKGRYHRIILIEIVISERSTGMEDKKKFENAKEESFELNDEELETLPAA